jgi:hypothetical protein
MTVIFIGGASAAGKTTGARRLGAKLALPVLKLDSLAGFLRPAIPDQEQLGSAARQLSRTLLCELLQGGAHCIVEGGWLRPPEAAVLSEQGMVAVYCGYANTTANDRLRVLRSPAAEPHWVADLPEAEALAWLERQIAGSHRIRDLCAAAGLAYVDCSRIEKGVERLCREAAALARRASKRRT